MHLAPLAVAIRGARLDSGLTLEQLAAAARVSRSTLAKIEAGATPDPGFSVVARLMESAGASEAELIDLYRATVAVMRPRAVGIGYEGLDQAGLIAQLRRQHVEVVADVRLTPVSRKPGLSKHGLAQALGEVRIDYLHLPGLGNPKNNRAGYSDPDNTAVRTNFEQSLNSEASLEQLLQLRRVAAARVVAVLCFERDERLCHRAQVLAALEAADVAAPPAGTGAVALPSGGKTVACEDTR